MKDEKILTEALDKIKRFLRENQENKASLIKFKMPDELRTQIEFPIDKSAVSENEFLDLLDKYLEYSVNTSNKQFLNQLYSGFNFPAFIGELFTALANTSMYTYEVAPVATLIETEMIRLMNSYSGYEKGDGIFVTGGSNANLIAMFSARNKVLPDGRFSGYDGQLKLKAFVSEQAHYSFDTAANILGIGANNVVKVKSDAQGRMIPAALQKEIRDSIQRGEKPFFVAATCATTLLGAYDPIDEMAEICKKHDLWLHADGSFGGSLILSKKHRHLMKGIEKTDSFAWNPHKLMNIPLICSVLLFKERGRLQFNITNINADYIYHERDDIEDLGKKSIQCGRRVDAVKLWFAWKYFGLDGYQKRIDHLMEISRYAEKTANKIPRIECLAQRQSFTLCFRYIPDVKTDLNAFNLALRDSLWKSGKSMVNYGYIGKTLCLRLITANAELDKEDIDQFFEQLMSTADILLNSKTIDE